MNNFNFGQRLRQVRVEKGISQDALALSSDITQSRYSRIERNADVPEITLVERLAKELGVARSVLLTDAELDQFVPKTSFEKKARELLFTPLGMIIICGLSVSTVNAAYDLGYGFCLGFQTSEWTARVVGDITGVITIVFIVYWIVRSRREWKREEKDKGAL